MSTTIKKKPSTTANRNITPKKKTVTESFKLNTDLKISKYGRSKRYFVV